MQKNFKETMSSQAVKGGPEKASQRGKKSFKEKKRQQVHKAKGIKKNFFKSISESKVKMQLLNSCSGGKANLEILQQAYLFPPMERHSILGKEHYFFNPLTPGFLNWAMGWGVNEAMKPLNKQYRPC